MLVDDDDDDVEITRHALVKAEVPVTVIRAEDGVEALEMLRNQGRHTESRVPDLVLLDLNMPRKGGLDVLKEIRQDERLQALPIVILTTSESSDDVLASYRNYANCFVSKQSSLDDFRETIQSIVDYWFDVAELPPLDSGEA